MQQLKLLGVYFYLSFKSLLAYRMQFIFFILHWILSFIISTFFWWVLFKHLPSQLGEWSFYDLCIINSMCFISWGLFTLFWGIHLIPEKILHGEIDKFLCRPISPIIGLIGEGFYLGAIYEILSGIFLTLIFTIQNNSKTSISNILLSIVALLIGTFGIILFHSIISLLSIWLGKNPYLQSFMHNLDEFQKYPSEFFPKKIIIFIKYFLPIYFPGTFATRLLLNKEVNHFEWFILGIVVSILLLLFILLYQVIMKKYVSAS